MRLYVYSSLVTMIMSILRQLEAVNFMFTSFVFTSVVLTSFVFTTSLQRRLPRSPLCASCVYDVSM